MFSYLGKLKDEKLSAHSPIGPLFLLLSLILLFVEGGAYSEQLDDAFITYRYAENLVNGNGLVFNVGEYVEGYTNLSWTLLVALGLLFDFPAWLVGHYLQLFSAALLLIGSYKYTSSILPRAHWIAGCVPLALLASNTFATWTSSGLETPLFAGLVVWAFYFYNRNRMLVVSVLCVLATMTRPEGGLVAVMLICSKWIGAVAYRRPTSMVELLHISIPGLLFALYVAAHTSFRIYYYGDVVPNTFYAKVGGIPLASGIGYVRNFFVDGSFVLTLPATLAAMYIRKFRIAFFYALLTIAYVVYIGGDAFKLGRFFLQVLPLLIAGAIVAGVVLYYKVRMLGIFVLSSIPCFVLLSMYSTWPGSIEFYGLVQKEFPSSAKREFARSPHFFDPQDMIKAKAQEIAELTPRVEVIAAVGIGKLGFYSMDTRILDLVGLVDRTVAKSTRVAPATLILPGHQRTDAPYILEQKPDIIWIPRSPAEGAARGLTLPAVEDLWSQEKLEDEYYWDDRLGFYRRK